MLLELKKKKKVTETNFNLSHKFKHLNPFIWQNVSQETVKDIGRFKVIGMGVCLAMCKSQLLILALHKKITIAWGDGAGRGG